MNKYYIKRKEAFNKLKQITKIIVTMIIFIFLSIFSSYGIKNSYPNELISFEIHQQKIDLRGKIVDGDGTPVPGVTVVVEGTSIGTTTDTEGNYILNNIPPDAIIQYSFIGMKNQKVPVQNKERIDVVMEEETIGLNEVVAIGYGVQRKVSITNAVSSINSQDLSERNSTNIAQALQGKLPGLTIIDRGGAPGSENLTTRIRGVTSLNDNDPLVLIDGVPGSLARVNPADIESVSVLKDAASTAIYGSRAAAGVILVTTKTPNDGKLSITYNGYFGIARSNNNPEHMEAVTYMKQQNEAYMNTYGYKFYSDEYIQTWPENHANDPEQYPLPNIWHDTLFRLAPQHSHTLTLSGGSERITNRLSFRYMNEEGILPNYGFNLSEMRAKNGFKLNDKLTFDTNINIRFSERNAPYNEWESYNRMWQNSQWGVPYYQDGSYGLTVDSYSPLINVYEMGKASSKRTYIVGIFKANYEISDGLDIVRNILHSATWKYGILLTTSTILSINCIPIEGHLTI